VRRDEKGLIFLAQKNPCDICGQCITETEANNGDFYHSLTRRKNDVFVHKHCWDSTYKVKGGT
jgi:hypothetical protein